VVEVVVLLLEHQQVLEVLVVEVTVQPQTVTLVQTVQQILVEAAEAEVMVQSAEAVALE
jgi:hypothetical protein